MNIAANVALALAATAALVVTAIASPPGHKGSHGASHAPYAGQDDRSIASLSAEDIDALLAGRGWGLAKPAELNGYPGPLHVLELAAELKLAPDQHKAAQESFDRMKSKAIEIGSRYVAAERSIDHAIRAGAPHDVLSERVAAAEKLRGELRMVHLQAHLEITPLLTDVQRQRYTELRGYSKADHPHDQRKP